MNWNYDSSEVVQNSALGRWQALAATGTPRSVGATGQGQRGQGCKQYLCPPFLRPHLPGSQHIYPILLYPSSMWISNVFESWGNRCNMRKPELNTCTGSSDGLRFRESFWGGSAFNCGVFRFVSYSFVFLRGPPGFHILSFSFVFFRFLLFSFVFWPPLDQWEF